MHHFPPTHRSNRSLVICCTRSSGPCGRLQCNALCTPVMGLSLWGVSPLCETGSLKEVSLPNERSDWQSTRRRQLRQSDPLGVTDGGKEAGAKAATLRTETSYKAGSAGRVSTTSRSRSQLVDQVKGRACAATIHALIRGDLRVRHACRQRSRK